MLPTFSNILRYFGFVPLFLNNSTENCILPVCLFLVNHIRFLICIYCSVYQAVVGIISKNFAFFSITFLLMQTNFVSACQYATITKQLRWQILKQIKDREQSVQSVQSIIWIVGFMTYSFAILFECFQKDWSLSHLRNLYCWVNFHSLQILQFVYLYFVFNIVINVKNKYQTLVIHFQSDLNKAVMQSGYLSLRNQSKKYIVKYRQLYNIVRICNDLFGWPLLMNISGLLMNMLSGAIYLECSIDVNRNTCLTYLGPYVTETVVSLVSH